MPDTFFRIRNCEVLKVSLEHTGMRGTGSAARPILCLPLKLQIMPTRGQQGDVNYILLRLAGSLSSPSIPEFAEFEVGPTVEESRADAYYIRQLDVQVELDHSRVRQFEDVRSGQNAQLAVNFSALVWFPQEQKFEKVYSNSPLQVVVPRSHWADEVLSRWGLSDVRIVEIRFPKSEAGKDFRAAYSHVEAAEKLFANGQYKQVLAELYSCFEGLAKSMNLGKPDQQFFAELLGELHPTKKESAKRALDNLCDFLHLGRHEAKEAPEAFGISRSEARFALIVSQAVLEYITPKG